MRALTSLSLLLVTALLTGCAATPSLSSTAKAPESDTYRYELTRSPSWNFQQRLHRRLYECEVVVLQGNNARLAGETEALPGYRARLEACRAAADEEARQAVVELASGGGYELRNAQKTYLLVWHRYLDSLSIERPADLGLKAQYLSSRAVLLAGGVR